MTGSLLDGFAEAVARHGRKTALVNPGGTAVSFADLGNRTKGLAAAWAAQGLSKGDRVLVAMPISADLYATLAALWSLGAVAVLPEPAMGLKGVRHALTLAPCKGLAASGPYTLLKFFPKLWFKTLFRVKPGHGSPPEHTPDPNDIALISFTSGSTGIPKAIARSHAFLRAQEAAIAPLLASDRDEVDLVAFPVFALLNLAAGRTSVLPNWRMSRPLEVDRNSLAAWIETQNITRALLPPALCETLANARTVPKLTHTFTGGGPVFPDLIDRLKNRHPHLQITAVYGSTEAEPIAHLDTAEISARDTAEMKNGGGLLAGKPVKQVQVRIEGGEILVAGDHVNKGYLDPSRDAETKLKEGDTIWHRTGDAGRLDAEGRLWLLGRFGANVAGLHPFEVEGAARFWDGVQKVALIGIDKKPVLVIEGDAALLTTWQEQAAAFNISDVRHVAALPLDRRHGSKVDYPALAKLLKTQL